MSDPPHHEMKLRRAVHHIDALEAEADRWLARPPYALRRSVDVATAERLLLVELLEPVPGELAAVAGDALHNLRSALDNLVYELAVAYKGEPLSAKLATDSAFPLSARTDPSGEDQLRRRLAGIHPEAREIVRGMLPNNLGHGGQENLRWLLNDLNVKDKHRLPHLGVPSPASVSFYVTGPESALRTRLDWPLLKVNEPVEIARWHSAPGIHAEPDLRKPPEFFVAFDEDAPESIVGRPVGEVLRAIHRDITDHILPPLTPYLS